MGRVRKLSASVLAVMLASVGLVIAPAGAQDHGDFATYEVGPAQDRAPAMRVSDARMIVQPSFAVTPCPEISDSIVRLYSAYFLRAPDEGGFDFWLTEYAAGNWGMPRMSAFFAQSEEFVELYGGITDAEFIDLIYANIFDRSADAEGRDFWLGRMANDGLDRGTVMLNFSESPEYIELTDTVTPLAGEFNWFVEGTSFACGFDDVDLTFGSTPTFVDIVIDSQEVADISVTVSHLTNGTWVEVSEVTVPPGSLIVSFARPYRDGSVTGIRLAGTGSFIWSYAASPVETPATRTGWTPV